VPLDLAEPFALTYERGRFGRSLRYDRPLPADGPPHPDDRAWAESLARAAVRG
jgi:hypothetical protein